MGQAVRALQYSTTEGDPALRARLAAFMSTRGLPVDADDLLVTTGSQQALGLVASALLDQGDVVLVENPTYLAYAYVQGIASVLGPPLFGLTFSWAVRHDGTLHLPGLPILISSALMLAAFVLSLRVATPAPVASPA